MPLHAVTRISSRSPTLHAVTRNARISSRSPTLHAHAQPVDAGSDPRATDQGVPCCWAEQSLKPVEKMLHDVWDLPKPDWLNATYYGHILAM